MAGISLRTDRTGHRNSPVTARCIAIVLGPDRCPKSQKDGRVVDVDESPESDKRPEPSQPRSVDSSNGKEIFEEFKVRNRTCYWNPALVESIKNLEYLGFVEPCTLLVGGEDAHLQNVRTAWGRHVLKPPSNFLIEKIGDVGGIQMQVVPQTQFIPLPESLCLIIMDLNNNRIVATLDLIRERLARCYGSDMQLPGDQLIYDTLGQLIRERKVFHTGSGYFVVTPDTYRLRTDDHSQTYGTTMVQYHPMYIPVPHPVHQRPAPARATHCHSGEKHSRGRGKLERSNSMKTSSKGKEHHQKECVDEPELKRSMSVKYKAERGKTMCKDINLKNSNLNQEKDKGEKVSLLSKLFGKGKKKAPPPPPVKETEYASFSAQFPPPEWQWYQQQIEKHRRVEDWVKRQIPKSETWHYMDAPAYSQECKAGAQHNAVYGVTPGEPHPAQHIGGSCPVHIHAHPHNHAAGDSDHDGQYRAATLPSHRHSKRKQGRSKSLTRPDKGRHKEGEITRSAERLKLSYESCENGVIGADVKENTDPQLQGGAYPLHSFMAIDEHPHPALPYHSTPRDAPFHFQPHPAYMDESYQPRRTDAFAEHNEPAHGGRHDRKELQHRSYKSKKKQHRSNDSHRCSFNEGDISYEYQGKLPKKESSFAVSCESGVNFVGEVSNDEDGKPGSISRPSAQAADGQPGSTGGKWTDAANARHKAYIMNNSVVKKSYRHRHRGHREKCIPEESVLEDGHCGTPNDDTQKVVNTEHVDVCVHRNFDDHQTDSPVKTNAVSTTGSSGEGVISTSEQSCDTVVDKSNTNQKMSNNNPAPTDNITVDGKEVSVGDSGIGSPRNVDTSASDKLAAANSSTESNIDNNNQPQSRHGLNILRNTDRAARKYNPQYRSSSGSAYASHMVPFANGSAMPLNNQRPISKESNLDQAHKQRPKSQGDLLLTPYAHNDMALYQYTSQGETHPQYGSQNDMEEKLLQVSRKFQMDGDFEVVGVV